MIRLKNRTLKSQVLFRDKTTGDDSPAVTPDDNIDNILTIIPTTVDFNVSDQNMSVDGNKPGTLGNVLDTLENRIEALENTPSITTNDW